MFKYGIENLKDYLHIFEGKGVGLITNPTGVDQNFKSTIDILKEQTNLKALFSPEHGVRGNLQSGVKLDSYIDEETGIIVYSLYGEKRAPTPEMTEDIDIICYDIQDVGARFYTYIYTMAYAMQAAKRMGKKMVVFDRPNPVGDVVEGNLLDLKYRSFIGYYSIPQRYGLTSGELAMLFNEVFDINCDLTVIKMNGYYRDTTWYDYNLDYILPSPNLPTVESLFTYLATCIFEGTNMSEGRGTTKPFSLIGAPWLKADLLIDTLEKHELKGIKFRKQYFTPIMSKHQGVMCQGIELYVTDYKQFKPVYTGMVILKEIQKHHPEFSFNPPYSAGGNKMIDLNVGDNFISESTLDLKQIKQKMKEDKSYFEEIKERYHLYDKKS